MDEINNDDIKNFRLTLNEIKELKAKMVLTFFNTSLFGVIISLGCLHKAVLKTDIKQLSKKSKLLFVFKNTVSLVTIAVSNIGLKCYNNMLYQQAISNNTSTLINIEQNNDIVKQSSNLNENTSKKEIKHRIYFNDIIVRIPIYTISTLFYYRKNPLPLIDKSSAVLFLLMLMSADYLEYYRL